MNRFRPSVESLETRETPSALPSVTDLVIDSYNPSRPTGPGVLKSEDGGRTWTASEGVSGRLTGIVADPEPAAGQGGTIDVHAHVITNSAGTGPFFDFGADRLRAADDSADAEGLDRTVTALLVAKQRALREPADGSARYFNGIVSRIAAGDVPTEAADSARPTILLSRLANPETARVTAPATGAYVWPPGTLTDFFDGGAQ